MPPQAAEVSAVEEIENRGWFFAHAGGSSKISMRSCAMPDVASLREGELVVRATHLSLDPCLRFRMSRSAPEEDFIKPFNDGSVISGFGLGIVEYSLREGICSGDLIRCNLLDWCKFSIIGAAKGVTPIKKENGVDESVYLTTLGLYGISSYLVIENYITASRESVVFMP